MTIYERATAVEVVFPADQDATYQFSINYPGDISITLDRQEASRYSAEVLTAVACAEHDAAVLAQMQNQLKASSAQAAAVLCGLREDRVKLDQDALGLLRLEPSVSVPSCTPFLRCSIVDTDLEWIWELGHAVEHAMATLLCCPMADLAVDYWRFLVDRMQVDNDRARVAVADLSRWRHWTGGIPGRHRKVEA